MDNAVVLIIGPEKCQEQGNDMSSVQERQKGLAGNNEYMTGGVILKFKPRVLVQGSLYVFHFVKMLKGNMHHKYDVSSKVAFYTIDLAAGIFF